MKTVNLDDLFIESFIFKYGDYDYFEEKSNGKLRYSFRMAVNVENGHMVKIVFDLNSSDVVQVGDHTRQSGRDFAKDMNTIKNIQKVGSTDFSSYGTVKAIVDLDTKERLKTVKTVGIIGNTGTRFNVPDEFINKKYGDEGRTFERYPVQIREKIAKKLNLNPPDALIFTVGEKEKIPSYKSTRSANSSTTVYQNEWRQGRGIPTKKGYFYIANSELKRQKVANLHINTAVSKIEKEYNKIKPEIEKDPENKEDIQDFEKALVRIKKKINDNKGENYGQTPEDPRYKSSYDILNDELDNLKRVLRKMRKKNSITESIEQLIEEAINMEFTEASKRDKVRDGYLNELPEQLQSKVMECSKIIRKGIDDLLRKPAYSDLLQSDWAMMCIDKLKIAPSNKSDVGSARIFKTGKNYKCEIQITGTFRNHQAGWIESLLNDFVTDAFNGIKGKIRQKYDIGLVNKGNQGQVDEGYALALNKTEAEELWNHWADKRERVFKESMELIESLTNEDIEFYLAETETWNPAAFAAVNSSALLEYEKALSGYTIEHDECVDKFYEYYVKSLEELIDDDSYDIAFIEAASDPETLPDYKKEYNTEMTEAQAKKTLRSLSQDIINKNEDGEAGKGKNKITQYTANIYANIITKNLLPKWAPGFKKLSITLDSYQSFFTFEFKIPTMSQDFVSRYIEGREPMKAFLHRVPEIKIKMSPRIFHTMKDPDDAFYFFKAAIQYYDSKIEKYSKSLMSEVFRLNHNMKHLISTTKLSGIVTYPMQLLFVFDDVHMDNKDTFVLSKEDINAVNQFIRNIYKSYAAPEKEKKKIVEDIKTMVKELHEACEVDDNIRSFTYLPEAVQSLFNNEFDKEMDSYNEKWIFEQVDREAMAIAPREVTALYEKFGVKKLKKIPMDLIAYIQIETESIKDANDKMMIASYCCSKIEIVEWYIELLEVGSKKYIVPHNKPYLENMRTQLLACYKKIMATPIPKTDRPIISIKYPAGYEG